MQRNDNRGWGWAARGDTTRSGWVRGRRWRSWVTSDGRIGLAIMDALGRLHGLGFAIDRRAAPPLLARLRQPPPADPPPGHARAAGSTPRPAPARPLGPP